MIQIILLGHIHFNRIIDSGLNIGGQPHALGIAILPGLGLAQQQLSILGQTKVNSVITINGNYSNTVVVIISCRCNRYIVHVVCTPLHYNMFLDSASFYPCQAGKLTKSNAFLINQALEHLCLLFFRQPSAVSAGIPVSIVMIWLISASLTLLFELSTSSMPRVLISFLYATAGVRHVF